MGVFDSSWQNVARLRASGSPRISTLNDVLGTNRATSTVGPLTQLDIVKQQAAQRFADLSTRQQAMDIAGGQQPEATGWRGLLANPIVTTVLKPLEILDLPRRVVASTLKEVVDAIPFNDDPNRRNGFWDEVSISDWIQQIKDPSFGTGTLLGDITPNKWVNRAIGLVGDIALDPMTYLTLGGNVAAKALGAGGRSGRIVMAERLIAKGATPERALQVARMGRGILNADELAKLGLDRAGVYFMGKRIRGTGRVGESLLNSSARTRIFMGDTLRGRKVMELFDPQDAAAARKAILSGTAPPERAKEYFDIVTARNYERAAWTAAARDGGKQLADMISGMNRDEFVQFRNTVYKVMEGAAPDASDAERAIATQFTDFLKSLRKSIEDDYKSIDPEGGFGMVDNYFPHMRTDDAIKFMRNPNNKFVAELREVIDNPVETMGVFKSRMVEGDRFFGQVLSKEDIAGGVARLNEIARAGGFAGDFFETDVAQVLGKYVGQWAEQKGVAAYMKHLRETGTADALLARSVPDERAVKKAIRSIAKAEDRFDKSVDTAVKKVASLQEAVTRAASKYADDLEERIDLLGTSQDNLPSLLAARDRFAAEADEIAEALRDARTAFDDLLDLGEDAARATDAEPLSLVALKGALKDAESRLRSTKMAIQNGTMAWSDAVRELDRQQMFLDGFAERAAVLRERGELIERLLNAVIDGGDVAGARADLGLRDVRNKTASRGARLSEKEMNALVGTFRFDRQLRLQDGNMVDAVKKLRAANAADVIGGREASLGDFEDWWKRAQGDAPIADKEFKNLSEEKVSDIVSASLRGDATPHEMRLATMWIVARDYAVHGGPIDEATSGLVAGMIAEGGVLERAAMADKWFRNFAKNTDDFNKLNRIDKIQTNYRQIRGEFADTARAYAAARYVLTNIDNMGLEGIDASMDVVPMLDGILAGMPELRPLFDDVLGDDVDSYLGDSIESLMQPFEGGIGTIGRKQALDPETAVAAVAPDAAREAKVSLSQVGRSRGDIELAMTDLEKESVEALDVAAAAALRDRGTMSVSEFVRRLEKYIDSAPKTKWDVEVETSGKANLLLGKNRTIRARDQYTVMGPRGEEGLIEGGQVLRTPLEVTSRVAGARSGPNTIGLMEGEKVFDMPQVGIYMDDIVDDVDNLLADGVFDREAIDNAIAERLKGLDSESAQWRKMLGNGRIVDRNGRKMRHTIDETKDELADAMTHLWFAQSVTERMRKVAEVLQPYNLLPTEEMYRRVVNSVAKSKSEDLATRTAARRDVMRVLSLVEERINANVGGTMDPNVARQIIEDELTALRNSNPEAAKILHRTGGLSSANMYYQRWLSVGGKSGAGKRRALSAERRAAGATKISKAEKAIKTLENKIAKEAVPAERDKLKDQLKALKSELDAFKKSVAADPAAKAELARVTKADVALRKERKETIDEIVEWWRDITGDDRTPTVGEIDEFLKTHRNTARSWDDPTSTIRQQLMWVRDTRERLTRSGSRISSTQRFLSQAADPWVDAKKLLVSFDGQTLPSGFAVHMNGLADRLEVTAKTLGNYGTELDRAQRAVGRAAAVEQRAAARAAAVTGEAPLAAGTSMGNLRRPPRSGWADTVERARDFFRRYNEAINTEEYAMAVQRKGEHDVMVTLSGFQPTGNDMGISALQPARDRARILADRGEIVMWQADDGSAPITVDSNWFLRGNNPTDGYYFQPMDSVIGLDAQRNIVEQASADVLPNGPSAAEAAARQRVEKIVGAANKQIAAKQKEIDAAQKAALAARNSRERAIAKAKREVERSKNVLDLAERRYAKKSIRKTEVDAAKRRLENARTALRDSFSTPDSVQDEVLYRLKSELNDLQTDLNTRRSRISDSIVPISYDGKTIKFSKAEWESLWNHDVDPFELQKDIVALSGRIDDLTRQRAQRMQDVTMSKGRKVRVPRGDADFYLRNDQTLKGINAQISEAQRMLDNLLTRQESLGREVRDSALQKIHWLRQGIKEQQIGLENISSGMYKAAMDGSESVRVALSGDMIPRRDYLTGMWRGSSEAKMLDSVDYLRQSAEFQYAQTVIGDADAARRLADDARAKANELDAAYLRKVDELEQQANVARTNALSQIEKLPEPLRTPLTGLMDDGFKAVAKGTKTYDQVFQEVAAAARAQLPEPSPLTARPQSQLDAIADRVSRIQREARTTRSRVMMHAASVQSSKVDFEYFTREVENLSKRLNERRARWHRWRNQEIVSRGEEMLDLSKAVQRAEDVANDARAAFDNASFALNEQLAGTTIPMLRERLENIKWAIANSSQDITDLDAMHQFVGEAQTVLRLLEEGGEDVSVLSKLLADENLKTYELLTSRKDMSDLRSVTNEMVASIPRLLEDGWVAMSSIGLPNTVVRKEIWDMLQNMKRLNQPAFTRELGRFLSGYTQFFKAYATLSPGFHVRNALSNAFSLIAAGSDVRLMNKSFKLARGYMEAFNNGTLPEFLAAMSEGERRVFEVALRAADASGGGRTQDALAGFMPKRNKLKDNALLRGSSAVGSQVEFTSRFMLAYDTVVQGLEAGARQGQKFTPDELFTSAAQRTKRYLIDYVDRGVADETVQNIVPFWMWMSRNFPLQVVNQWTNPKAYAAYNSFMRNITEDDEGDIVPSWLTEQGAGKIAADWYLAPDLGFNRLQQQAQEFADPVRLLSYVNPALRVPMELAGDRKFYNSVPFNDKPQQVTGGPAQPLIEALLRLAGQTDQTAAGETVTSDKANYALMNSLPFLSQAERLAPATDSYQARQLGSWLSYFGVPVKQVTPQMRESEVKRRERQLQELQRRLTMLGYTP